MAQRRQKNGACGATGGYPPTLKGLWLGSDYQNKELASLGRMCVGENFPLIL
jgi:hypothetical protein